MTRKGKEKKKGTPEGQKREKRERRCFFLPGHRRKGGKRRKGQVPEYLYRKKEKKKKGAALCLFLPILSIEIGKKGGDQHNLGKKGGGKAKRVNLWAQGTNRKQSLSGEKEKGGGEVILID